MFLLFFDQLVDEGFIKAFCWTLVHSLWQGLVIAVLSGLVIAATRKAKAQVRYHLLLVLFGLFLAAVTFTFVTALSDKSPGDQPGHSTMVSGTPVKLVTFSSSSEEETDNLWTTLSLFLNEHAPLIVLCWFLFFIARFCQLCFGFSYIHRLKKSAVVPAREWNSLITTLTARLGMRQQTLLMESPLVSVPLTFGFLKATILVPVGLLSNLPLDQVEAVLLHELAHIRRRDYAVNLFQNSAELIFFFNPALLWLSSLIRQEREACCDDIVLEHTAQKQTYLEALVSFQEYSLAHAHSALALSYKKSNLLNRIQRMLTKENQKLNNMEKAFLFLGIIAITAFGFIQKQEEPLPPAPPTVIPVKEKQPVNLQPAKPASPAVQTHVPATPKKPKQARMPVPAKKDSVPTQKIISKEDQFSKVRTSSSDDGQTKTYELEAIDKEGKTYRLKKINDALTELMIDGKTVDPENEAYRDQLAQLERLERTREQKARVEAQKRQGDKMKQKMEKQKEEFSKQRAEAKKQRVKAMEAGEKSRVEMKKRQEESRKIQAAMTVQKEVLLEKRLAAEQSRKKHAGTNGDINGIINELSKRGIVTSTETLSFSLTDKELMVNGKKQPGDLHQSLKEKYIKKPGDQFHYSKNGGSISTTINKE